MAVPRPSRVMVSRNMVVVDTGRLRSKGMEVTEDHRLASMVDMEGPHQEVTTVVVEGTSNRRVDPVGWAAVVWVVPEVWRLALVRDCWVAWW
jgi:hypothetical protein